MYGSVRGPHKVVDGFDYFRLDCTARVVIHFERLRERSTSYGPFERLSAVNGLTYGDDRVLSFLDTGAGGHRRRVRPLTADRS